MKCDIISMVWENFLKGCGGMRQIIRVWVFRVFKCKG
jgi:hypothetical protein